MLIYRPFFLRQTMLMAFHTYNLLQDCTLVKSDTDADAEYFLEKDA